MSAIFQLIDVSAITCNIPESHFDGQHIELIASAIIETGMLTQPLLLRIVGLEEYEVMGTSALAYWGAVRAKELEPRKYEMVASFVLTNTSQRSARTLSQLL